MTRQRLLPNRVETKASPSPRSPRSPKSETKYGTSRLSIGTDASTENKPENHSGEISFRKTLTFCRPYIIPRSRRHQVIGAVSVLCTLLYKACLLVPGYAMKIAVDALSSEDEHIRTTQPIIGALAYFLGRFFAAFFGQGQDVSLEYCTQHMARQFAKDSFGHLQSLSLSYHNKKRTGETTSILGRGIGSIQTLMRLIVFSLGPTLVEAAVVSGIFFTLGSPLIAFCTGMTVILYIVYTGFMTKWRVRFGRELREAENKAWGRATESIMNFGTVKSFGMEKSEVVRYDTLRGVVQGIALKVKGINSAYTLGQNFIIQLGTFLGLVLAAREAIAGNISAGDFIMVQAYIGQLFGPLLWLGASYGQVVTALTEVEQVMDLFDTIPEVQDVSGAQELQYSVKDVESRKFGSISFENVSFLYDTSDKLSGGISNLSFHIPAGKMVALVGPSGAGKSTIGKLLLRLYDVNSGSVAIDGQDIRGFTQVSLRKAIGLVAQETILFNDTVRNNITYGKPEANDAQVWAAVRMASLEKFVAGQSLGLDTVVGERGVRLSGGERQRVGIARAILKQPGIMMLDESTSALSTIDEREIQKNLKTVCTGRTTLAIAHRLSTVMMADEILVIKDGVVAERGNHVELVKLGGIYGEMWRIQSGEDSQ